MQKWFGCKIFWQLLLFRYTSTPVVFLAFVLFFALNGNFVLAQDVSRSACECELLPGNRAEVRLSFSNTGNSYASLLAAIRAPESDWRFYSPGGIIDKPTWLPVPPGSEEARVDFINEILTENSLPFGHAPLVGPFRYQFIAALYDNASGGIAILTHGLFGHNYTIGEDRTTADIVLLLSLDRAEFGDIGSEQMKEHGVHNCEWALVPHERGWQDNTIPQLGWSFNAPFHVITTDEHAGELPGAKSFAQVSPQQGVIVSSLYREGPDLVVRLSETEGSWKNVSLSFPGPGVDSATLTKFLGDSTALLPNSSPYTIELSEQAIETVRLELSGASPFGVYTQKGE